MFNDTVTTTRLMPAKVRFAGRPTPRIRGFLPRAGRWLLQRSAIRPRKATSSAPSKRCRTFRAQARPEMALQEAKAEAEAAAASRPSSRQHEPRDPHAAERDHRLTVCCRNRASVRQVEHVVPGALPGDMLLHRSTTSPISGRSRRTDADRESAVRARHGGRQPVRHGCAARPGKGPGTAFSCFENDRAAAPVGDSLRLTQVLVNPDQQRGQVHRKRADPRLVSVAERREAASRLEIAVQDTGIGIRRSSSRALFRASGRQFDDAQYGGTGLGLMICDRLVADGRQRSAFQHARHRQHLPVRRPFRHRRGRPGVRSPPLAKPARLVVDDNATNRTVILHRLLAPVRRDRSMAATPPCSGSPTGATPYGLVRRSTGTCRKRRVEVARRLQRRGRPAPRIVVVTGRAEGRKRPPAPMARAGAEAGVRHQPAAALNEIDSAPDSVEASREVPPAQQLQGLRVPLVDDGQLTNRLSPAEIPMDMLAPASTKPKTARCRRQGANVAALGCRADGCADAGHERPDATRAIRADAALRGAADLRDDGVRARRGTRALPPAGMDGFPTKPIDPDSHRHAGRHRRPRRSPGPACRAGGRPAALRCLRRARRIPACPVSIRPRA